MPNTLTDSLYERLGATEGITNIANDLIDNHFANPEISKRFAGVNRDKLKKTAMEFVVSGTGGPSVYTGKDMVGVHKAMNINAAEFMAVIDDALRAMAKNNVGQREQEEIAFILLSMRGDVMGQ